MAEGLKWRVNRAVRASNLAAPARLIMLVLSDMADAKTAEIPENHGPSLPDLVRDTGLGESTVKRRLAELEESGWVIRMRPTAGEQARHKATRYRLTVPTGGPERAPARAQSGPPVEVSGAQSGPGRGPAVNLSGAQSGPPYIEANDPYDQLHDQIHTADGATDGALFAVEAPAAPVVGKANGKHLADGFDRFWKAYPKKVGKPAALRAWIKAIKNGADAEIVIAGAEFYALEKKGAESRYIKNPQGWLNDGRWQDEPDRSYQTTPLARTGPWRNPEDQSDYYGEI